MATSADRELKILLSLVAGDMSGSAKVRAEIKAIETDQARLVAQLKQQTDVSPAVGRRIEVLQQEAVQQNVLNAQAERRVILETQLEAAEARLAGNPALAARLEREAEIRARALTIQRTMNITTEESIVLAERLVLAQEAQVGSTALLGINAAKAKTEFLVLGRELAAGNVRASTLSSLLGSMGTAFTISGIAAYSLYQILDSAAHKSLLLAQETRKQTDELVRQLTAWSELAQAAGDSGDVIKFGEKIGPELEKASAKLEEFRNEELGAFKLLIDSIASQFSEIPGYGPKPNQDRQDKQTATQASSLRSLAVEAQAWRETANQALRVWESIKLEPLNTAIEKQSALVDQAKSKYADLQSEAHKLAAGNLDDEGTQKLLSLQKELDEAGRKVELQTKRLDELTKTNTKLATETDKVSAAIAKVNLGELTNPHKLEAFATEIDGVQARLLELGVDADSPNAALEKSKTLTAETREEVIKLIAVWAAVLGEIKKTNDAQTGDARRAQQQDLTALLREQATVLQDIHQQQQLISTNPFLNADAKQALLANLYLKEEATILAEIAKIKAKIKAIEAIGGPDEQAQVAELNQKLQGLEFTFKSLDLKVKSMGLGGELANWVQDFGSSSQQIAGLIEGSINSSLEATNQLLLDAAFRTGDWRQTVVGLERSILNMFLTMLEKMILQQVMSMAFQQASTQSAVAAGLEIAAAHAPAAAATSISSYGAAAVIGEVLALAAIVAIMAALGGGFKKGGYTGAGREDEIAGPAHRGEFYFSKSETESIGLRNLYALKHSAPHFGSGARLLQSDIDQARERMAYDEMSGGLGFGGGRGVSMNPSGAGYVNAGLFQPGPFGSRNTVWFGPPPSTNPSAPSGGPSVTINQGGDPASYGTSAGIGTYFGLSPGQMNAFGQTFEGYSDSSFPKSNMPIMQATAARGEGGSGSYSMLGGFYNMNNVMGGGGSITQFLLRLHYADGGRIPGPASKDDNILAWLSSGERVIPAERNLFLESRFGFDWDKRLAIERPRFAAGGRVGSQSSQSGGQRSGRAAKMKLVIVNDLKSAIREAQSEPEFQTTIINAVHGARHELGLPSVE